MTCEIIKDLIPMYVDKTASREAMIAVKKHIDICPDCRKFYNSCLNSERKMSDMCKEKLPSGFRLKGSDISQLDQQYAHFSRKLKLKRIRQTVIGIAVLCGMVVYVVSDIAKAVGKKQSKH